MRAHGAFDPSIRFLTTRDVAKRCGMSAASVLGISSLELPFMEVGGGRLKKHRRYHSADVEAFDVRRRARRQAAIEAAARTGVLPPTARSPRE